MPTTTICYAINNEPPNMCFDVCLKDGEKPILKHVKDYFKSRLSDPTFYSRVYIGSRPFLKEFLEDNDELKEDPDNPGILTVWIKSTCGNAREDQRNEKESNEPPLKRLKSLINDSVLGPKDQEYIRTIGSLLGIEKIKDSLLALQESENLRKLESLGIKDIMTSCSQIYLNAKNKNPNIEETGTKTKILLIPPNDQKTVDARLNAKKEIIDEMHKKRNDLVSNKFFESDLHNLYIEIMKQLITEDIQLELKHEKPTFKNRMHADFSLIKKERPCEPNFCAFVIEILKNESVRDSQHLGQVLVYNELILERNPKRLFILGVLTNLKEIILFKTQRCQSGNTVIHSMPLNFWTDGLQYLTYMLIDPVKAVGYDESLEFEVRFQNDEFPYFAWNYLGSGISADVFVLQKYLKESNKFDHTSLDYVVKIFKTKDFYDKEKEIFDHIENLKLDTKHIVQAVQCLEENLAIVLSPLGTSLKNKEMLTKSRVKQMFTCVRELQEKGVIHRDISPSHFFISNENTAKEYVFLIDVGSAIFMGQEDAKKALTLNTSELEKRETIHYSGSIQFAASEILANSCQQYQPHRRHDLESLVKSLFFLKERLIFPEMDKNNELFANVKKWWDFIEEKNSQSIWRQAFEMVRSTDISYNLINELEEYLLKNLVFYDSDLLNEFKIWTESKKIAE